MESRNKPTEQDLFNKVTVRLIQGDEKARWNELIEQEHYLHNPQLVGEQLRHVAEVDAEWLALLSWSAAAYHIAGRDRWIGWSDMQRRNRLHVLVSKSVSIANRSRKGSESGFAHSSLKLATA